MKKSLIAVAVLIGTIITAQSYEYTTIVEENKRDSVELENYILDVVSETDWWADNFHRVDSMSNEEIYQEYRQWEDTVTFINPFDDLEWVERVNNEMDSLTNLNR
jgi:hypothetical protein